MSAILPILLSLAVAQVSSDPYARSRASTPPNHCLWWHDGSVVYTQSQSGYPPTQGTEFAAVTRAWSSWQAIQDRCGNLTLSEGPRTSERKIGYDQNSSNNLNLILFRTRFCSSVVPAGDPCFTSSPPTCNNKYDCWPDGDPLTIALTTTTFNVTTGRILDADVELNGASRHFTTADAGTCSGGSYDNCVSTDVQSAMTHEFGHSLGLDHTTYPGSVMNPSAGTPQVQIQKRVIDPGSSDFICQVYPKGGPSRDCIIVAATSDLGGTNSGGCTSAAGVSWLSLAPLAILLLRGPRRRA